MLRSISRRAFLKQSSSTLALAALPPLSREDQAAGREGRWMRVTTWRARVHSEPHPKAPRVGERDYDAIVTILDEVTGVGHCEHNPTWYRIVGGYTYSSWVQPMETVFNRPIKRIEAPGMLAWVTLPYTDVRASLAPNLQRGSRLYYDAIFRVFDLQAVCRHGLVTDIFEGL